MRWPTLFPLNACFSSSEYDLCVITYHCGLLQCVWIIQRQSGNHFPPSNLRERDGLVQSSMDLQACNYGPLESYNNITSREPQRERLQKQQRSRSVYIAGIFFHHECLWSRWHPSEAVGGWGENVSASLLPPAVLQRQTPASITSHSSAGFVLVGLF